MRLFVPSVALCLVGCTDATELPTSAPRTETAAASQTVGRVVRVTSVAELRAAVAGALPYDQILMAPGTYDFGSSAVKIDSKRDLEVYGSGRGNTVVRLGPDAALGLELAGDNSRISIGRSISQAIFFDLDIRDVAVGISIVTPLVGHCSMITVYGSYFENMQDRIKPDGATSGSGYGIHNENCWRTRIANNVIRNADRHAIYQGLQNGRTGASGVLIEHNLILDHATTASIDQSYLVALVVARSKDVVVTNNVIVAPAHIAMSIEEAEPGNPDAPSAYANIQFVNNTVIGSNEADLYVTAPGRFIFAGNRFAHRGSAGMRNTPTVPGAYFSDVQDLTSGGAYAYVPDGEQLSEIDATTWAKRDAPFRLPGTTAIGFSGSSVISLSLGRLNRINPRTWSREIIGNPIPQPVSGMAMYEGIAYILAGTCMATVNSQT